MRMKQLVSIIALGVLVVHADFTDIDDVAAGLIAEIEEAASIKAHELTDQIKQTVHNKAVQYVAQMKQEAVMETIKLKANTIKTVSKYVDELKDTKQQFMDKLTEFNINPFEVKDAETKTDQSSPSIAKKVKNWIGF